MPQIENTSDRSQHNLRAAHVSDLGSLVSLHQGPPVDRSYWMTAVIPGLGIILGTLGYGFWRAYYGYTQFGPVAAQVWSRPWFLAAALAAALLLLSFSIRQRAARKFVVVYKNGVRLQLQANHARHFHWSQISGISIGTVRGHFLGLTTKIRYRLVIHPNVGRPVRIEGSLQNFAGLIDKIKEQFYPRRFSELQRPLRAGEWVYFGPLAVNQLALRVQEQLIAWEKIKRIAVDAGVLTVELKARKPMRVPTAQIQNLELLLKLIEVGVV